MRQGAAISGAAHAVVILTAAIGFDWFDWTEKPPLPITNVTFIDSAELDARLSKDPNVDTKAPGAPPQPSASDAAKEVPSPDDRTDSGAAAELARVAPPDERPDKPESTFSNPTNVPTEDPEPTIAEVPSPNDMVITFSIGLDGYVATPGGRLWRMNAQAQNTVLLCDTGCLLADPRFVEDPRLEIRPVFTLRSLLESLNVGAARSGRTIIER